MKWHKISDGDYPKFGKDVLVAFLHPCGVYDLMGCEVAIIGRNDVDDVWYTSNATIAVKPSDRWAYIDLPVD